MEHPNYSEETFWDKIEAVAKLAKKIAKDLLSKALVLYYVLSDPDTPAKAKAVVLAALAYFINPLDLIPDYLPVIGFQDDLAVLAGAIFTIAASIKLIHRIQADEKMEELFGDKDDKPKIKPDDSDDNPPQIPEKA